MNTKKIEKNILIIGGGSAGTVLASRLSEDKNLNITLLEAGEDYINSKFPESISNSNVLADNVFVGPSKHDWMYKSTNGQLVARGKVIGGSSSVNASVTCRALPYDFKLLEKQGLTEWSWDKVLPYYLKMENYDGVKNDLHSQNGLFPIHQNKKSELTKFMASFIDSTIANNYKEVTDFNDHTQNNGVGPNPVNIVKGVRQNNAMNYLNDDVRARKNLTIISNTEIDKLVFKGNTCVGAIDQNGKTHYADEIILSAGAIGSALILMRSGIGPKEDLQKHGINVLKDSPVGTKLLDHVFYWMNFTIRKDLNPSDLPVVGAQLWTNSKYAKFKQLDIGISPSHLLGPGDKPTESKATLGLELMECDSRGTIKLSGKSIKDMPLINFNHLSASTDMDRMVECFKIARKISKTKPLSDMIIEEVFPGKSVADNDDAAIRETLLKGATTLQHISGSVPMGVSEKYGVVDQHGKVYGFESLRVIDASIFPTIPLINLNPTVTMMAEKLSDHIKNN